MADAERTPGGSAVYHYDKQEDRPFLAPKATGVYAEDATSR